MRTLEPVEAIAIMGLFGILFGLLLVAIGLMFWGLL